MLKSSSLSGTYDKAITKPNFLFLDKYGKSDGDKRQTYTCIAFARLPLSNLDSNISVESLTDLSILTAHCSGPVLIPPTRERTNCNLTIQTVPLC